MQKQALSKLTQATIKLGEFIYNYLQINMENH